MSWHHLKAAWDDMDFQVSAQKFVFVVLADMANDAGETWPAINTISDRTFCSRSTVKRCIHWLKEQGKIIIIPAKGRGNTNRIQIVHKTVHHEPYSGDKTVQDEPISAIKGFTVNAKRVHHDRKRVQALNPYPPDPSVIPQPEGGAVRSVRGGKGPSDYQLYWITIRQADAASGALKQKLLDQAAEFARRMGIDTSKPPPKPPPSYPVSNGTITPEELLEGARYLVSIGKSDLLTDSQRKALDGTP
jgi:hypothetical protein